MPVFGVRADDLIAVRKRSHKKQKLTRERAFSKKDATRGVPGFTDMTAR
jgi:hypothetical protein